MHEQLKALDQNNTWTMVLRNPDMNIVGANGCTKQIEIRWFC